MKQVLSRVVWVILVLLFQNPKNDERASKHSLPLWRFLSREV
jgi:hypothetical protein